MLIAGEVSSKCEGRHFGFSKSSVSKFKGRSASLLRTGSVRREE
jgi:hypothetical protein